MVLSLLFCIGQKQKIHGQEADLRPNGWLFENECEIKSKNFVICDDICDGGRTFIEIAKAIRNIRPEEVFGDNIYLVVTHSIFSAGFEELEKWFTGIYTTNSVKDIDNELVTQINVF